MFCSVWRTASRTLDAVGARTTRTRSFPLRPESVLQVNATPYAVQVVPFDGRQGMVTDVTPWLSRCSTRFSTWHLISSGPLHEWASVQFLCVDMSRKKTSGYHYPPFAANNVWQTLCGKAVSEFRADYDGWSHKSTHKRPAHARTLDCLGRSWSLLFV